MCVAEAGELPSMLRGDETNAVRVCEVISNDKYSESHRLADQPNPHGEHF